MKTEFLLRLQLEQMLLLPIKMLSHIINICFEVLREIYLPLFYIQVSHELTNFPSSILSEIVEKKYDTKSISFATMNVLNFAYIRTICWQ